MGPPNIFGDQLSDLREPLRRQVQAVTPRLRLSEEEVARLVTAVLDVVARHLPLVYAEVRRGH